MKREYTKPTMEVKEFAQFENVFTWCDKAIQHGCADMSGSGNAEDVPKGYPNSGTNAHKGGETTGSGV